MSGIYTPLCSGLLFPLHERLKGHTTARRRRELEQSQWWPAERLQELQLQRLKALLLHAGMNVPYYRKLFADIGFDPAQVSSLRDLGRLPLLSKDALRAQPDAFRADGAEGLRRLSTTGSSGDPMQFQVGRDRVSHDVAAKWRATRWWGVDIGDPEIVAWSSPIEVTRQDRVRWLRDRLFRTHLVPSARLTPKALDDALGAIRRVRPAMLFGYPSALSLIAEHAENLGMPMDRLGIKVAFVTAERTYPHQRALISRVFGCPVANGYGGRDAGFIAHECPHGGLHLSAEDIIVEIVDEDGKPVPAGVPGEVVVTHLATGDYPFIRYRNGDVGVLDDKQCACGRGLPLIREIQGRTNDFLVAADGSVIHDVAIGMILRETPGVRGFKVIQESLEETRVLLATNSRYRDDAAESIRAALRDRLGAPVRITVEVVPSIPPEPTGKYRYVVSRVRRTGPVVRQPAVAHEEAIP